MVGIHARHVISIICLANRSSVWVMTNKPLIAMSNTSFVVQKT